MKKLYTQIVEHCGLCPGSYLKYRSVVGPKPLYCKLVDKETKSNGIPDWCPLFDYTETEELTYDEKD